MKKVFKKGHKKQGGRKKGTPNKITTDIKELNIQIIKAIQQNIGIDTLITRCHADTLLRYIATISPKNMEFALSDGIESEKSFTEKMKKFDIFLQGIKN